MGERDYYFIVGFVCFLRSAERWVYVLNKEMLVCN